MEQKLSRAEYSSEFATNRRDLMRFFVLTYAITWGVALLYLALPDPMSRLFGEISPSAPLYFLAVYAPSLAALILTFQTDRLNGVVRLLSRLRPRLANWPYYLAVLVSWPLLDTLSLWLQHLITGEEVTYLALSEGYLLPGILLFALITDAGPLGEELGWRGYALPRMLQGSGSPLTVAIALGLIWGAWHLPAFFVAGTYQHDLGMGIVWLLVGTTLVSVIMTWLFGRTGGDVLAAGVLVHLINNLIQGRLVYVNLVYLPLAVAAGIALVRQHKLPGRQLE